MPPTTLAALRAHGAEAGGQGHHAPHSPGTPPPHTHTHVAIQASKQKTTEQKQKTQQLEKKVNEVAVC